MERYQVVKCSGCGAENPPQNRVCSDCGASLQLAQAEFYLDSAEVAINRGDYEQATRDLILADRAIIALSGQKRGQFLLTARAFWLQGSIFYGKSNMERAKQELVEAQMLLEGRAGGRKLLAEVLNRLGLISYHEGNESSALSYYRKSSELAIAELAYGTATKAINNMGNIYVSQGDIGKAIECYSSGLVYAEQAGGTALAQAYSILTWVHANYGPYSQAIEYADKAFALREQIQNLDNRALVVAQAGAAYLKYGDLEQAEQYLREAYTLVQRTGNRIVEEQVLEELAQLVQQKDDQVAWQDYAMKAFRASASSPFLRKESALQLVIYYIKQQDWTRATRVLRGMKESYRQAGSSDKREAAIIAQAEALLDTSQRRWEEAERHFKLALGSDTLTSYEVALVWEQYADMLLQWIEVAADEGKYARAREALMKAGALFRELELPFRVDVIQARLKQTAPIAASERSIEAGKSLVQPQLAKENSIVTIGLVVSGRASATSPCIIFPATPYRLW